MNCPSCGKPFKVQNTYLVSASSQVQRMVCDCGVVATATVETRIVNLNPDHGEGAAALAKRLKIKTPAAKAGAGSTTQYDGQDP